MTTHRTFRKFDSHPYDRTPRIKFVDGKVDEKSLSRLTIGDLMAIAYNTKINGLKQAIINHLTSK